MIRRLGIYFLRMVNDLQEGDFARRVGHRGVGLVENIENGFALIAWDKDRRDILPLGIVRRVKSGGHRLDCKPPADI